MMRWTRNAIIVYQLFEICARHNTEDSCLSFPGYELGRVPCLT